MEGMSPTGLPRLFYYGSLTIKLNVAFIVPPWMWRADTPQASLLSQGSPGTQCPPHGTVKPGPPPPQGLTALGACSAPPSHTPGATEHPGGTELPARHSWSPAGLQAGAGARAASGSTAGQQTLQT